MEYYKDNQIEISYIPEKFEANILYQGFPSSHQYRKGLKKIIEVVAEKKLTKLILDTPTMKMIGTEDQKWTVKYFLPMVYKHGCKVAAIIPSQDYFNRVSVTNIIESIQEPCYHIKITPTAEAARQWIDSI
jgi:hypothetical protein